MTALYGILGFPVSHSRSPAMHNAAFRALGLDAQYLRFEVEPAALERAVAGLSALGVCGVNVTIPHKSAVMPLVDDVTPAARAIGAVNTLVRHGDDWLGHNTDAAGLARSLDEAGVALKGARAVVLGAGGAARASVVGLAERGALEIVIAARRMDQAELLARELASVCGSCRLSATDLTQARLEQAFAASTLVVQSTSATLHADTAQAYAETLPFRALPAGASVVDLVYKPLETTVLAAARASGLHCVDGLGMLLHQGALAFELWTGRTAPLAVMRSALETA